MPTHHPKRRAGSSEKKTAAGDSTTATQRSFDELPPATGHTPMSLRAHVAADEAMWWADVVRLYEADPTNFSAAWAFLTHHPANLARFDGERPGPSYSRFQDNLDIAVVLVNPDTERVEDDASANTAVWIWLEWGPWCDDEGCASHDPRVATGAASFEGAVVNLAHNVYVLYQDAAAVPFGQKLKKKDRW